MRRTLPALRLDWRQVALAYPPVLAAAFVLSIYTDTPVSLAQTFRALAVAIGVTTLVQLGLSLLLRSPRAGALGAAFALLFSLFGFIVLAPLTATLVWEWARLRLARTRGLSVPSPAAIIGPPASVFTVGFLAVALATGIGSGAIGLPRLPAAIAPATAAVEGPDMFVILLDAYARADTLAELGYDNSPFLEGLEERGFQVPEQSRSNYSRTGLTLASMFNMAYIADLPALASPPEGYNEQHRLISDTLHSGNPALDALHRSGYESFYIPSRVAQYAVEPVNHMLAGAELDNFEIFMLGKSVLGPRITALAAGTIYDQQRSRTLDAFATIARLAGESNLQPRFVFAHLMMPHPPFVFDADGATPPLAECTPTRCAILEAPVDGELHLSRYLDQLAYTNKLVTQTVDAIIAAEPDAVIVLMSDHGSRITFSDRVEATHNFMAIRANRVDVPQAMTPIGLFPLLLNAYLGTAFESPDARSFASLERTPWPMVEVR